MFNFFSNNNEFPTKLFVSTSLLSLLLLGGIIVTLTSELSAPPLTEDASSRSDQKDQSLRSGGDDSPLITKVPKMEDMLDGPMVNGGDPSLGPKEAPVTIVEFADYECGACVEQQRLLKRIRSEYKDKVRLIWKDYPVADRNSDSFRAARAARCAGRQNVFWGYNQRLYERGISKKGVNEGFFVDIAREMELDIPSFKECYGSEEVDQGIINNIKEANALQISGIPFVYVNDQQIMGGVTYEELKRLVEIEMEE